MAPAHTASERVEAGTTPAEAPAPAASAGAAAAGGAGPAALSGPFGAMPRTPAEHFRLHYFAAVFFLANYLYHLKGEGRRGLERTIEAFPFLGRYLTELRAYLPAGSGWRAAVAWWDRELAAWEEGAEASLPLCRALHSRAARVALLFIGLIEEDSRFGDLFASLQEPKGARRPTLDLVEAVMSAAGAPRGVCRELIALGLASAVDPDQPQSEWELRIPAPVWSAVRGERFGPLPGWVRLVEHESLPTDGDLVLPTQLIGELARVPALLAEGQASGVIVRGTPGSDRLHVIGWLARALGRSLLVIAPEDVKSVAEIPWLGTFASLTASLPAWQVDVVPGESCEIPPLAGYDGPVAVAAGRFGGVVLREGREAGIDAARGASTVTLTLPAPDMEQRRRLWRAACTGRRVQDLTKISERFRLPSGYIRRAGSLAVARSAVAGRRSVTFADAQEGVRLLGREALETLATRIEAGGTWDDLVVTPSVWARLKEVHGRCRHRETISDNLGQAFRAQPTRGVRALLSGPSGTGKTLAAKILAAELGMDLYQIDVSAVVNKYIGVTEKNLHRALTAAEDLDVILLLDEGDSLMARRSEVRGANDRYANLETNFLLQRLEVYEGIIIITTNALENIDPAFQRRMDVVVHFSLPQPAERLAIWKLHLPRTHSVDPSFLESVARRCALTGGQIRSAAQHAALLALEEGKPIDRSHLEAAIYSEYRKAGALCPLVDPTERAGGTAGPEERPAAFLRAVTSGGLAHGRSRR